jgi:hypothetical protein
MTGKRRNGSAFRSVEQIIESVTLSAHGDNEQLWAFRRLFEDEFNLPADGFVLSEPVSVTAVDYDGNARRGLTAVCRKEDGETHVVSLADVAFAESSPGAQYVAAYRKWAGLEPFPVLSTSRRKHRASEQDIDISQPVELILLNIKERAARCRIPGSERIITLRSRDVWRTVPGEFVTVRAVKHWRFKGSPYLSGAVESRRIDITALGLKPLRLEERGIWDPAEDYWREEDEPPAEWEEQIIRLGPRPSYEMEQVIPGNDPEDPFGGPFTRSDDLKNAGDPDDAHRILMELAEADLRCLDAHYHLGNLVFDFRPQDALRHYEIGMRIGELSLGKDFRDVLLWEFVDNQPFLRCLHGYGLCLWRMGRFREAEDVIDKILRLNPPDNQCARFLLPDIRAGKAWEENRRDR